MECINIFLAFVTALAATVAAVVAILVFKQQSKRKKPRVRVFMEREKNDTNSHIVYLKAKNLSTSNCKVTVTDFVIWKEKEAKGTKAERTHKQELAAEEVFSLCEVTTLNVTPQPQKEEIIFYAFKLIVKTMKDKMTEEKDQLFAINVCSNPPTISDQSIDDTMKLIIDEARKK